MDGTVDNNIIPFPVKNPRHLFRSDRGFHRNYNHIPRSEIAESGKSVSDENSYDRANKSTNLQQEISRLLSSFSQINQQLFSENPNLTKRQVINHSDNQAHNTSATTNHQLASIVPFPVKNKRLPKHNLSADLMRIFHNQKNGTNSYLI